MENHIHEENSYQNNQNNNFFLSLKLFKLSIKGNFYMLAIKNIISTH